MTKERFIVFFMKKDKEKPRFTIRVKDFKNIPPDAFKYFKNHGEPEEEECVNF